MVVSPRPSFLARAVGRVRRTLRPAPPTREEIARIFLHGSGIEVGALHRPLQVGPETRVRYLDRLPVDDLRRLYPELRNEPLVPIDILDDGERMASVADASQDFVIENHFLEHCEDPIGAIAAALRVLRPGGVLFAAVPDKRFTFDRERPTTTLEHLRRDHAEGPAGSRRAHFLEWARFVWDPVGRQPVERTADQLMEANYSIHFHVWSPAEVRQFLDHVQASTAHPCSELAFFAQLDEEILFVLRRVETPHASTQ